MAAKAPAKFPFMVQRGNTWAAMMRVPADLKTTLGKSILSFATGETNALRAAAKAQPVIDVWHKRIEQARNGTAVTVQQKIDTARAAFRRAQRAGDDPWAAVETMLAGLGIEADASDEDDLDTIPTPSKKAVSVVEQVMGEKTPFSARIDAWEGQLGMGQREASMYASDVRAFSKQHPTESVEGLDGATVQAWIESQDAAPKTIQRKLSALRNYWGWLQAHEVAQATNKPFHGRKLPKAKKDAVKRQAFTPADITKLLGACEDDQTCQSALNSFQVTASKSFHLVSPISSVSCAV
jgi:hypothetical protein